MESLEQTLENEGYTPGTPAFERQLLTRKVRTCQENHGQSECAECTYYEWCDLVKQYMTLVKYRNL
jgi:hypothetical protein